MCASAKDNEGCRTNKCNGVLSWLPSTSTTPTAPLSTPLFPLYISLGRFLLAIWLCECVIKLLFIIVTWQKTSLGPWDDIRSGFYVPANAKDIHTRFLYVAAKRMLGHPLLPLPAWRLLLAQLLHCINGSHARQTPALISINANFAMWLDCQSSFLCDAGHEICSVPCAVSCACLVCALQHATHATPTPTGHGVRPALWLLCALY